jgi:hypothetical protein
MTIKQNQNQTATEGTDNLELLTDRELNRVAGDQGAHYKTVTLVMRKSAGSETGVF